MKISSPLRYPGGKAVMSGLLAQIRKLNGLGDRSIAEPFSGGAGASLSLLFQEATPEIYINDADPAIYGFWWTIVNRPKPFFEMLKNVRINMTEWYRQRNLYRKSANMSMLHRGFAAFYLNRCNRSGIIIDGGPIGGYKQNGKWRLNARFNKSELFCRCEKIFEYRDRDQEWYEFLCDAKKADSKINIQQSQDSDKSEKYIPSNKNDCDKLFERFWK